MYLYVTQIKSKKGEVGWWWSRDVNPQIGNSRCCMTQIESTMMPGAWWNYTDMSLRCIHATLHIDSGRVSACDVAMWGVWRWQWYWPMADSAYGCRWPPFLYGLFMVPRENLCLKLPLVYLIWVFNWRWVNTTPTSSFLTQRIQRGPLSPSALRRSSSIRIDEDGIWIKLSNETFDFTYMCLQFIQVCED